MDIFLGASLSLLCSFTTLSYSSLSFLQQKGEDGSLLIFFYYGYLLHALLTSISLYHDLIEFMSYFFLHTTWVFDWLVCRSHVLGDCSLLDVV